MICLKDLCDPFPRHPFRWLKLSAQGNEIEKRQADLSKCLEILIAHFCPIKCNNFSEAVTSYTYVADGKISVPHQTTPGKAPPIHVNDDFSDRRRFLTHEPRMRQNRMKLDEAERNTKPIATAVKVIAIALRKATHAVVVHAPVVERCWKKGAL